jgi:non-ribosomal peptide synthetase component E (peptide arylation enzyme)
MFFNMLMMMNVTTFCMMATMMLHVVLNMLVVMLDVTAVLHTMNVAMLLGMRMLNMMQMGFAKWQVPDRYEWIAAVPRTSTGKFYKLKLREMFPA